MHRRLPVLILLLVASLLVPSPALAAGTLFVSPSGDDGNSGASAATSLATIQEALDRAGRGTTVRLGAGTYLQDAVTRRAGVTVSGPRQAVVKGGGNGRIFEINHDDTTLSGFTIDGQAGKASGADGFRDKLVFVVGTTPGDGVGGTRIQDMALRNAGGECIRLKYLASGADISGNTIGPCGVHDFRFGAGGKNGEGVYIGTAPEQLGRNPDDRPDVSRDNKVHDNRIDTGGNECVDIKEGSTANDVFANDCTGQRDPNSAGMDARGSGNAFRGNRIHDNVGAGIRFGGDTATDGTGNDAIGNEITGNRAGGIKFQAAPQGQVCGNRFSGNGGGVAVGAKAAGVDPARGCPPGVDTGTAPPRAPTPAPTTTTTTTTQAPAPSARPGQASPTVSFELDQALLEALGRSGLLQVVQLVLELLRDALPELGSVTISRR